VQAELEPGHDAEVSAAATQAPQQLRVALLPDRDDRAVRRDQFGGDEAVAGQPERPGKPADTTAEGQSGDARVGHLTARQGELVLLGHRVEFTPDDARLRSRSPRRGVDSDGLHLRQVDDEAALARRVPRNAVATAPHRDREVVPHAEPHCCSHVRSRAASGDEGRPQVEGTVPDPARLVEAVVPGPQDCAGEPVERTVENRHGSDRRGRRRHRAIPGIGGCLRWSASPQSSSWLPPRRTEQSPPCSAPAEPAPAR
jgi:hypothetical protein